MSKLLSSHKLQQRGSCLRIMTTHCYDKDANDVYESRTYEVDDLAAVRFTRNCHNNVLECSVSAKKLEAAKDFPVEIKITSEELQCSEQLLIYTQDWSEWKFLGQAVHVQDSRIEKQKDNLIFFMIQSDIVATMVKPSHINAKIYLDDDFIDFHLTAVDGSVGVHKVYLAAHSDVFKRMLQGKWKETAEGCVELEGLTRNNLQHFKEYLYLGTLPDDGLRPLLLLARYFLIDDLKEECMKKLVNTVTPDNLYGLLEFACEYNLPELTIGILHLTPDETVYSAYKNKRK